MTSRSLKKLLLNPWVVTAMISTLAVAIYSNIYNAPFVFDDIPRIVDEEHIKNNYYFTSILDQLSPRYLPTLSLALNYRLGGLDVFGYHLFNVLIHIVNGIIVYFLARTLFGLLLPLSSNWGIKSHGRRVSPGQSASLPALFAALVFVAHPLQTQAVTYTIQRIASMAALFYLGAVLFYLRGRISSRSHPEGAAGSRLVSWSWYLFSILSAALAIVCKGNAATLPAALLLTEYLCFERSWRCWKRKLPVFTIMFLLWGLYVLFVYDVYRGGGLPENFLEDVTAKTAETKHVERWRYLYTQFNVITIYIRLLFLPIGQKLDDLYFFKKGFFDGLTPLALAFLGGIISTGVWASRKHPVMTLSVLWFFLTLSIESSIIPISDAAFEHRLYLPMFGFALCLPYIVFSLLSPRQKTALIIMVLVVAGLGTGTYLRNGIWTDDAVLWADCAAKAPHNFRAFYNLGEALGKQGKHEQAVTAYQEALTLNPRYIRSYLNLGKTLVDADRNEDAVTVYRRGLEVNPEYVKIINNLGSVLATMGRTEEAVSLYRRAIEIDPTFADSWYNQGNACADSGQLEESIPLYHKAIEVNPSYTEAYFNLANSFFKLGRKTEAIPLYEKTIAQDPDHLSAHKNLAITAFNEKLYDLAVKHCDRALELGAVMSPEFLEALKPYRR